MSNFHLRVLLLVWLVLLLGHDRSWAAEIRGGWSTQMPYQYESTSASGVATLQGLDIEIMKAAARRAGLRPTFEEITWAGNLSAVRAGQLDFALAATPEDSRREWAWFTVPYRKESLRLFMLRGDSQRWPARSAIDQVRALLDEGGRLAVIRDFYYGPDIEALLRDESLRDRFKVFSGVKESLASVLTGECDAFLADRLSAASAAYDAGALGRIGVSPGAVYETDLSIMLSKESVPPETLEAFNEALTDMQESGEINRLVRHYLVPHLLLITMHTSWFLVFEIAGTVAFALSGVIIARRERYDLIGACVLAALPALGGGVMRDLVADRSPIGILQSPNLIIIVLLTVAGGMAFFTLRDLMLRNRPSSEPIAAGPFRWLSSRGLLEVFDAIGLATFTIIGVMVALEQQCEPLWLWGPILAALTAAGGGVLRDVLRSQSDIPTLKGSIYPEIAILWGLVYSLVILIWGGDLSLRAVLLVTIGVMISAFLTRILVVHFGLQSIFLGFRPSKEPGVGLNPGS